MKQGTKVWHKRFGIAGVVLAHQNSVFVYVLWSNGERTEANVASLQVLSS